MDLGNAKMAWERISRPQLVACIPSRTRYRCLTPVSSIAGMWSIQVSNTTSNAAGLYDVHFWRSLCRPSSAFPPLGESPSVEQGYVDFLCMTVAAA